jgi:predicted ArsR family transcriptional regulator
MDEEQPKAQVEAFIRDQIDSVPHMEALLLLWNHRPKARTIEEMASALFVARDTAKKILQDLTRQSLLETDAGSPPRYSYAAGSADRDRLMTAVDATYRRDLVRLTGMIHAKGSQAAREFARAFLFTKDKERK